MTIETIRYSEVSAAVTNGAETEIIIDRHNRLVLMDEKTRLAILLGSASQERVDELIFNLQQIRSVCS